MLGGSIFIYFERNIRIAAVIESAACVGIEIYVAVVYIRPCVGGYSPSFSLLFYGIII